MTTHCIDAPGTLSSLNGPLTAGIRLQNVASRPPFHNTVYLFLRNGFRGLVIAQDTLSCLNVSTTCVSIRVVVFIPA
jgi:hypothetical protein